MSLTDFSDPVSQKKIKNPPQVDFIVNYLSTRVSQGTKLIKKYVDILILILGVSQIIIEFGKHVDF